MRAPHKRLLIVGGLICLLSSFSGRGDEYTIWVKIARGQSMSTYTKYLITGDSEKATVKYFRLDSVYQQQPLNDPAYPVILKTPEGISTVKNWFALIPLLDSLSERHSKHIESSATVYARNDPQLFKQIDSMLHAPDTAIISSKRRIILDGVPHQISVKAKGIDRNFYASSPVEKYHPLMFRFIRSIRSVPIKPGPASKN